MRFYFIIYLMFLFLIFPNCGLSVQEIEDKFNDGIKNYSEKNLDKAIVNFTEVVDADGDYLPARIMLGKSLYYKGDYEKALKIFYKIDDDFSGNSLAKNWIGKILIQYPEKLEESKEYFLKSIQFDDNQIDSYFYLGRIAENKGDLKSALLYYNKGIEISKKSDKIFKSIKSIYDKAGVSINEKSK